jgi:hypothetical protein
MRSGFTPRPREGKTATAEIALVAGISGRKYILPGSLVILGGSFVWLVAVLRGGAVPSSSPFTCMPITRDPLAAPGQIPLLEAACPSGFEPETTA